MRYPVRLRGTALVFTLVLMAFLTGNAFFTLTADAQLGYKVFAPAPISVKIDHVFTDTSPYGTVAITGSYFIGENTSVGAKHTLTFTITDATQRPVPGLPLNFSVEPLGGTAATAVFDPHIATTDQDGVVQTQITFGITGEIPAGTTGELRLIVEVDRQQIVDFAKLELVRHDTRVQKVVLKAPEHGFARAATTQSLVFIATDANGRPVPGSELTFGARGVNGSAAAATFSPAVMTTDQNGEARPLATFGAEAGALSLTVQAGSKSQQINIVATQVDLGRLVKGTFTGLKAGDSVDLGSTHNVVFTATDTRGKPVSDLPIAFRGIPAKAAFDPAMATTDRNGQVRTRITFGQAPGNFEISVSIDSARVIVFSEPDFRFKGTRVANVAIRGMEEGFAQAGRSKNLVFTATDIRGNPVATKLRLGVIKVAGTQATAVLDPATVITDKKGVAKTVIKFGARPGEIRLRVKAVALLPPLSVYYIFHGGREWIELDESYPENISEVDLNDNPVLKHKIAFRFIGPLGRRQSGIPILFESSSPSAAKFGKKATARAITDSKGVAKVDVTFSEKARSVSIFVKPDLSQLTRIHCVFYPDSSVRSATFPGAIATSRTGSAAKSDWDAFGLGAQNTLTSTKQVATFYARTNTRYKIQFYPNKGKTYHHPKFNRPEPKVKGAVYFVHVGNKSTASIPDFSRYTYFGGNKIKGSPPEYWISTANGITVEMELGRKPGDLWIYLVPPKRAEVTSNILISGVDDDTFGDTSFERSIGTEVKAVNSSTSFRKLRWVKWKATDEIRVNTDLYTRRIDSTGVEIAAYAELHELDWPQKSDRDDFKCGFIKIGWNGVFYDSNGRPTTEGEGFRVVKLKVVNEIVRPGEPAENKVAWLRLNNGDNVVILGGHQESEKACKRLGVNPRATPEFRSGDDANVYFDVEAMPVRRVFANTSAPSAPMSSLFSNSDVNGDRQVNVDDLVIAPEKMALLHNYPNPFNPETWIPYHLAEPADVTLTIYSVDGKVVRKLDLGYQAAGFYQSKSRAAYWDGRNNVGERVASGLYFYTFEAGDFSATKKMLIRK